MIDVNEDVVADVSSSFAIPPKPELLTQLQDALKQPEPDLQHIGELVAQDVATSAAVLKIINSPVYGMSRVISDIKQAVMFLGVDSIASLVTGVLVKQAFKQTHCPISLDSFWSTAHAIADATVIIGKLYKSRIPIESLHSLALFHDCGIPLMAMKHSDYKRTLVEASRDYGVSIINLEEEKYSTNHAVVGYYLATAWHLPKDLCQIILRHHDVEFFDGFVTFETKTLFAILKMAENVVHQHQKYVAVADWPHIKAEVLDTLDLSEEEYQDLKDDIEEMLWSHE